MMSLTAYAKRRGVSPVAVSKAVARGRLSASVVRDERGQPKIADPELADREWAANTRSRTDFGDGDPPIAAPLAAPGDATPPRARAQLPDGVPDYNTSRARRAAAGARLETARADIAELDLAERLGRLVPADDARSAVIARYSLVKTRLLGVPSRFAQRMPELAATVEPVVDELIREALEELAAG